MPVKWTKEKSWIVTVQYESGSMWYDYGPFHMKAAAAYAARVIRENIQRGKQPSLTIFNIGHEVVEVLGGNNFRPSPHYRVRIADSDIYDMALPDHRAELDYVWTACYNAGANGTAR